MPTQPCPWPVSHRLGKSTGEKISWYHDSDAASNRQCVYCARQVTSTGALRWDKEHLIGNNFVPSGTMGATAFNFLFRACRDCNASKAVAERHLSSVTLISGTGRHEDPRAEQRARRKETNDFHPSKPGVAMGDAAETLSVLGSFGTASLAFGLTAPAQAVEAHVHKLALRHVQGMLALITTRDYRQQVNVLPPSLVLLMGRYDRKDWGHPWAVEVADRVADWPCYANIVSADGYFKVIIRCNEQQGWFWALEWNKYTRVIGGICHAAMAIFDGLPDEGWFSTPAGRMRVEIPLVDEDDVLFAGAILDRAPPTD